MYVIRQACGLVAACLVAVVAGAGPSSTLPADVADHLIRVAGFTEADIAALEAGRVIGRAESGAVETEMIALAAVKIRVPRASVAAYYGQMATWVDGEVTMGSGRFSAPPALSDVSTLTLERGDIDALRSCKPGDCDVRIGGAGIDNLRRAIDWKAPDAAEQAQRAVRQAIVDYVAAYQARGDEALITYNDASKPVRLADQWQGIIAGSRYFHQYQPALRDYLTQYPQTTLPGGRDIIYWVKENFGLKPTVSVVHAVFYDAPGQPDRTTIVQKQIYASHYYDASLAFGTLISATEGDRPITYLVYVNRSRGDMLKGGFGGLKRAVARDQARKAAEQTLGTMQTALESAARVR